MSLACHAPALFEGGQSPGERLGLDSFGGSKLSRCHRAAAVEVGKHAQLNEGFTWIRAFHAQSSTEADDSLAHDRSRLK